MAKLMPLQDYETSLPIAHIYIYISEQLYTLQWNETFLSLPCGQVLFDTSRHPITCKISKQPPTNTSALTHTRCCSDDMHLFQLGEALRNTKQVEA